MLGCLSRLDSNYLSSFERMTFLKKTTLSIQININKFVPRFNIFNRMYKQKSNRLIFVENSLYLTELPSVCIINFVVNNVTM